MLREGAYPLGVVMRPSFAEYVRFRQHEQRRDRLSAHSGAEPGVVQAQLPAANCGAQIGASIRDLTGSTPTERCG